MQLFNVLFKYFTELQGRGLEKRLQCLLLNLITYVDFEIIWPDCTSSLKQNKAKGKKKEVSMHFTKRSVLNC